MPRDLFGEVTRPSISIGDRKWYSVPVSLLSHSAIVAMFLVLPILAAPLMPQIGSSDDSEYLIEMLPPPPPPPLKRVETVRPVENIGAVPFTAPDGFTKEPETLSDPPAGVADGCIFGSGNLDKTLAEPAPPARPTPPQPPLRIGGTIRSPQKLRGADPVYPSIAQAARIQGIVIIEATIGADGRVVNARLLRSVAMLDQAAIDAVQQWEYSPTMLNGVPVPVIMTVTVQFTLSR